MAECRSCGAVIRWGVTTQGGRMPLDAAPAPLGNVFVLEDGRLRVLSNEEAERERSAGAVLYVSHHATCPSADRHRCLSGAGVAAVKCAGPDCDITLSAVSIAHGARYCDARCRAAAFRARNGYLPLSAGGPRPVAREGRANGSRSKPSGRQIAYGKAVAATAGLLVLHAGWSPGAAQAEAEAWMRSALPERQQA